MEDLIKQTLLKSFNDLEVIYLFGSLAKNQQNQESDIDIAFRVPYKVDKYKLWLISQELAKSLKRDVDLINLFDASTVIQFQVMHEGKRIFCKDQNRNAAFEDYVFATYVELNERRAGILSDIKSRGSVYG